MRDIQHGKVENVQAMTIRTVQKNLKITCPECQQKLDVSGLEAFSLTACPTCETEILVPRRFGQYLLERPLSETETAGVYLALDLKLQREIAVKILGPSVAARGDCAENFLQAARESARLNHPNVVPIYTCGEHEDLPYVVMEYLNDGSLADHLALGENGVGLSRALHVVIHASRGLHAANQHNVLHGNVAPGNILMSEEGDVKMADFGMALAVDAGAAPVENLAYASPELLKGESWDYRSDIYALGGTFYHALAGRRPFADDYQARMKSLDSRPPSVAEMHPEWPGSLPNFLDRCMAPDPDERPRSYNDVLKSLTEISNGIEHATVQRPSAATGRKSRRRTVTVKAVARGEGMKRLRRTRRKKKSRRLVDIAVFATVLFTLLVLAHGARNKPDWYMNHVRPVILRIAVHVGAIDPQAYLREVGE